jgi:ubiquinone/menaquinone biosynthesis C-methylase UbiE
MDLPTPEAIIASNRDAWNDSARHHKDADHWRNMLEAVAADSFSCLDQTLTDLLQSIGVAGKSAIQLGCNNGRESLSLFSLGAREVVGADQSRAFLDQAEELASHSPHRPEFIEADIHQLPVQLQQRFDIALITIGVLNWMPDVARCLSYAAQTLRVGGTLVIYETHPTLELFDPHSTQPWLATQSYFRTQPRVEHTAIVYTGASEADTSPSYWFVHRLSDIIGGVLESGLQLTHFKEYAHSNREDVYDVYVRQPVELPMCYTLAAVKVG